MECLHGRGWERIRRRCPTSGTLWWINASDSDIVSQGLPRAEMALNESTLFCVCLAHQIVWKADKPKLLHWLLQVKPGGSNSGHYVDCDCSAVNGNRGLPFPSQQPLCVDSKGQMLSDLPTGIQLRMQALNTQVPSEYYVKLKINWAAKRTMHHTYT